MVLALAVILIAGTPFAWADQVTLSYIDIDSNAQTLTVDAASPAGDLALAASLVAENGVGVVHDPDNGSGTLADIAAAMAQAAPVFAAEVAQVLAALSPEDTEAIVAAVNAVPGVNTQAVLAAVRFGPPDDCDNGPQMFEPECGVGVELLEIERVPSRN